MGRVGLGLGVVSRDQARQARPRRRPPAVVVAWVLGPVVVAGKVEDPRQAVGRQTAGHPETPVLVAARREAPVDTTVVFRPQGAGLSVAA